MKLAINKIIHNFYPIIQIFTQFYQLMCWLFHNDWIIILNFRNINSQFQGQYIFLHKPIHSAYIDIIKLFSQNQIFFKIFQKYT